MIHSTQHDKNRHWHLLLLLMPSVVFVVVLALFLRNRYVPANAPYVAVATPVPTYLMKVGETPVTVRLAVTEDEHRQGLSGVTQLMENEGMLFVFKTKTSTAFWMKDMKISLDILWIRDGKVIQINETVLPPTEGTPDSKLPLYLPHSRIDHVLEVNAGFSKAHNLKVGDIVTFPTY